MIATLILLVLNMIIPILMIFTSYRNIVNFYFSSTALSSSLINCLYLFYLVQTLRSRVLSEINCRAIYYLQTSCIVVLAYTITAMHANFVLCLFPSPPPPSSDSTRTCSQSCGLCLRRFFRRFSVCLVLCVWSLSFTSTIPLLYTIDSNEKSPKPVYCPGTTEISYLEEWFDRNRFIQTIIFNLIPLLISLFLSLIALLKLFYDCLIYLYLRLKMSKFSSCRQKSSYQQQRQSIPNSISLLSSFGMIGNSNYQRNINLAPIIETPTSEITVSSSNTTIQTCTHWFSTSFLRFLLVLSCCLLACIYPIVMRFYLIYFSVLVPLIFAVLNYSLGQLSSTEQQTISENHNTTVTTPLPTSTSTHSSLNTNISKLLQTRSPIKRERNNSSTEQFELRSPLIANLLNEHNESPPTPSSSSPSLPIVPPHHRRSTIRGKRIYFSNHLYENTRNMFTR